MEKWRIVKTRKILPMMHIRRIATSFNPNWILLLCQDSHSQRKIFIRIPILRSRRQTATKWPRKVERESLVGFYICQTNFCRPRNVTARMELRVPRGRNKKGAREAWRAMNLEVQKGVPSLIVPWPGTARGGSRETPCQAMGYHGICLLEEDF